MEAEMVAGIDVDRPTDFGFRLESRFFKLIEADRDQYPKYLRFVVRSSPFEDARGIDGFAFIRHDGCDRYLPIAIQHKSSERDAEIEQERVGIKRMIVVWSNDDTAEADIPRRLYEKLDDLYRSKIDHSRDIDYRLRTPTNERTLHNLQKIVYCQPRNEWYPQVKPQAPAVTTRPHPVIDLGVAVWNLVEWLIRNPRILVAVAAIYFAIWLASRH